MRWYNEVMAICSIEDCDKASIARTWCHSHYMRFYRRGGDPGEDRRTSKFRLRAICIVDDCENDAEAHGWCVTHYAMSRRIVKIYPRECAECGLWFIAQHRNGIYCTRSCKRRAVGRVTGRRFRENHRGSGSDRWYLYGINSEQFAQMVADQNGCCAICQREFSAENHSRKPCIDHDHKDGRIRGVLCFNCNVGIGRLDDDPIVLRRAVAYLEC